MIVYGNIMLEVCENDTYKTKVRGNEFTIWKVEDGWNVSVSNASSRVWNRGFGSVQPTFDSLKDIENKYKSLKGLSNAIH